MAFSVPRPTMEVHLLDFLSMLARWLHIIAGVAWIGSSFYFIWLDNSLEAPEPGSEAARKGVAGELWAVHGGGFYNPQKYAVAPASLPARLHWFKWEAYTTWLSGSALLVLVYYIHAQAMMTSPRIAVLESWQVIGIGVASMVVSWFVYDLLCRSPFGRDNRVVGAIVFALLTALGWVLSKWLSGRAVYIHVGTAIGTIMAANVFFVIIPGQKRMVAAMREGRAPNPEDGRRAKQRSVHNNYFTLPVLFIMISNHYASTYGHPLGWAVLAVIGAAGVSIRQFFNRRHKGALEWRWLAIGAALLAFVAWWTAPKGPPPPMTPTPVAFNQVHPIIQHKCAVCHMPAPVYPGIATAPSGVLLHTPRDISQNAQRIYLQTAVLRVMPLGNVTQLSDEERAMIARWYADGHPVE
jgi:uncharacterized membrane protein